MRPLLGGMILAVCVGLVGFYYGGAAPPSLGLLSVIGFFGGFAAGKIREPDSLDWPSHIFRFFRSLAMFTIVLVSIWSSRFLCVQLRLSEEAGRLLEVYLVTVGLSALTIGGLVFGENKELECIPPPSSKNST